jgi:hypothetical protein
VGKSAGSDPEDAFAKGARSTDDAFEVVMVCGIAEDGGLRAVETAAHRGHESIGGQAGRQDPKRATELRKEFSDGQGSISGSVANTEDTFAHYTAERWVCGREDGEVVAGVSQDCGDFCDSIATKDGVNLLEEFDVGRKSLCDASHASLSIGDCDVAALRGGRLNASSF